MFLCIHVYIILVCSIPFNIYIAIRNVFFEIFQPRPEERDPSTKALDPYLSASEIGTRNFRYPLVNVQKTMKNHHF